MARKWAKGSGGSIIIIIINNILMITYVSKLLIKLTSIVINSTRTKLQIIPCIEGLTDLCIWDVKCSFNSVSITEVWWCWSTVSGSCK